MECPPVTAKRDTRHIATPSLAGSHLFSFLVCSAGLMSSVSLEAKARAPNTPAPNKTGTTTKAIGIVSRFVKNKIKNIAILKTYYDLIGGVTTDQETHLQSPLCETFF